MANLKVASYNCRSVKSSVGTVQDLCKTHDIVALQETWLYEDGNQFLSALSVDFNAFGVSAMNSKDTLISGRPHGGIAFLWRKNMSLNISAVEFDDARILGLRISDDNNVVALFITVYLPYECDDNAAEYSECLGKLMAIVEDENTPYVYIIGDFNAFWSDVQDYC
jgi:exonuclease III